MFIVVYRYLLYFPRSNRPFAGATGIPFGNYLPERNTYGGDYWEACRLWLNAEGKLVVTARARTLSYYVDCFDWASEISLKRPNEVHWLIADTYVSVSYTHLTLPTNSLV